MSKNVFHIYRAIMSMLVLIATTALAGNVQAQCPGSTLTGGLLQPSKIIKSEKNLLVAEVGTGAPNSGRISIVDENGNRRTLLDGLPSGINATGEPSGPGGLYLQGRTLYIANGEGDSTVAGPIPGTELPNPNPSSPIFSSILALHFSAEAEKTTNGYALTQPDHQALKNGEKLELSNGNGGKVTIELVADFPDFTPASLPFFPPNVRHSNPFGVTKIGNFLYLSDGGQNSVLKVDVSSGAVSTLTAFPPIVNPAFPFGGPFIEAVPDSIRESDGQLLVTLLRGFPFLPGTAQVMKVDPATGAATPLISGLTSAIDVLPVKAKGQTSYLTLEISTDLLSGNPGQLQRFASPAGPGVIISNCLIGPSSMVLDEKAHTLYVAEIFTGRVMQIPQ
ncbi:MAG: hypothetical protein QOD75_1514 [Blastocatellia bacterium]|jgi:hypothetical protein|nr:hypothetical protein [Blastocatellia bacterium]